MKYFNRSRKLLFTFTVEFRFLHFYLWHWSRCDVNIYHVAGLQGRKAIEKRSFARRGYVLRTALSVVSGFLVSREPVAKPFGLFFLVVLQFPGHIWSKGLDFFFVLNSQHYHKRVHLEVWKAPPGRGALFVACKTVTKYLLKRWREQAVS